MNGGVAIAMVARFAAARWRAWRHARAADLSRNSMKEDRSKRSPSSVPYQPRRAPDIERGAAIWQRAVIGQVLATGKNKPR